MKYASITKHSTKKIIKAIKKSKKQEWFRYFLDTVVVIVGILTAFALTNWKENNAEKNHEQKILKIIQSEFAYNKNELARNIDKASRLHARADTILGLYEAPKAKLLDVNLDSVLRGLTAYSSFDPSNGALSDLIGSGDLRIIRNDSLRRRLSKWSGEVQDVKEDEIRLMQFGGQYLMPYLLKYLTLNPDSKFKSKSTLLFDDVEFENVVSRFKSNSRYIIEDNYGMLNKEISAILTLLEKEIEN